MRVLHLITTLSTGGAEVTLQKLVRALDSRSYTASVVSLTKAATIGSEMAAQGTPVLALGGRAGILLPHQLGRLIRAYREFEPHVVHSWMYHANVLAQVLVGLTTRKIRPGLVISVRGAIHAPKEQKAMLRAVRRIDARMSHRADAIVFNSGRSAEQHVALGYESGRITVIPNFFDTTEFKPMPTERARVRAELGCGEAILIGLVARFERLKDQRLFLQAARLVADRFPRCRFLLAGRGCDSRNAKLMRWVSELNLKDRVYALGERRDIAAIDNALDVAVCSSISESFPNAIGEAMACGVPSVVTDVGDCQYLVGDTGFVVAAGDARELADAIVNLVQLTPDERLALGVRARARVVAEFSPEQITRRFADLYEACGRRR